MQPKPKKKRPALKRKPISPGLRYDVLARANFRCEACGRTASEVILEIDHVIPVAKGGKSILKNLQALCKTCNQGKGAKLKVVRKKKKP